MSNILDKRFEYHPASTHERVEPFEARLRAARERVLVERRTKLVLRYAVPMTPAREEPCWICRVRDSVRAKFDLESA